MIIQQHREQISYFNLRIKQHKSFTAIRIKFFTEMVNTQDIPLTYSLLQKFLPSILQSRCYNPGNLPFFEEVKKTELGHLFEHILLEYLCTLKIQKGYKKATYKGRTYWDWSSDPRGTFHIITDSGNKDRAVISRAIIQSTELMNLILQGNKTVSQKTYRQAVSTPVYMTS